MKKLSTGILAAALTVGIVGTPVFDEYDVGFSFYDVEARSASRSSSRSSFSRSSSRKSSGGFSVWGNKSKSGKSNTGQNKGKVNLSSNKDNSSKTKKLGTKRKVSFGALPQNKQNRVGKQILKAQREKHKAPPVLPKDVKANIPPKQRRDAYRNIYRNNAVYNSADRYDSSTYYNRREHQYGRWNTNPPSYVTQSPASFGMWDAMAMYWMIDMMTPDQSASFAYNQQNNDDFQNAMNEMEKQGQSNAELQAKLSAMEAKMNGMTGTPDPSFVPKGIDGDLLLSAEALDSARPDFRMCVGGETGTYFRTAAIMSSGISKVNIIPVTSAGSGQCLQMIQDGKVDGAFIQADAYWNLVDKQGKMNLPFEVVMEPYHEDTHLVCHEDGPSDLTDLVSDKYSVWFPSGSGAAETWTNLIAENENFASINTVLNTTGVVIPSYETAMLKAKGDPNACFLYVGVRGSGKFTNTVEVNARNTGSVLIDLDDEEILDTVDPVGRSVYKSTEIPATVYPNLIRNEGTMGFGKYVNAFSVGTDIIVANNWKDKHSKLYPTLVIEMMATQPDIDILIRK